MDSNSFNMSEMTLGAGYDIEEKRVIRAMKIYETELLPFIKENSTTLKLGNFLEIKGYGTNIEKKYNSTPEIKTDDVVHHQSKKIKRDD